MLPVYRSGQIQALHSRLTPFKYSFHHVMEMCFRSSLLFEAVKTISILSFILSAVFYNQLLIISK